MALHPNDHDRAALRDFELLLDRTFSNITPYANRHEARNARPRGATRLSIFWGMEAINNDWQSVAGDAEADNPLEKRDPFLVDWEGPDDPKKPLNWGGTRWVNVGIVSFITFLSYVVLCLLFSLLQLLTRLAKFACLFHVCTWYFISDEGIRE